MSFFIILHLYGGKVTVDCVVINETLFLEQLLQTGYKNLLKIIYLIKLKTNYISTHTFIIIKKWEFVLFEICITKKFKGLVAIRFWQN